MSNRLMSSALSVVQDNPSVAAGTSTFAIAFALVAGNAFFAQSGTHPEPIWATRDATFTHSVENTLKPVKTTSIKRRDAAIPVPTKPEEQSARPEPSQLVTDLQKALSATGDFNGVVDGLIGPQTRNAIISYQKRNGFEETGKPSKLLLTAIQQTLPMATGKRDSLTGLISASQGSSTDNEFDRETVRLIQGALAKRGMDITVDGIYGSNTRAAIEAFQRDHGLKVTGKPEPDVLEKLRKLGAVS